MAFFNARRNVGLFILFWLIFFSFAAYSRNYHFHWIMLAIFWGMAVITDFVFLGEDTFIFDSNFKSWQIRSGTAD
ncbi:hypothetical protein AAMO2058_000448000 [Amorphochlora amoebiformis]